MASSPACLWISSIDTPAPQVLALSTLTSIVRVTCAEAVMFPASIFMTLYHQRGGHEHRNRVMTDHCIGGGWFGMIVALLALYDHDHAGY